MSESSYGAAEALTTEFTSMPDADNPNPQPKLHWLTDQFRVTTFATPTSDPPSAEAWNTAFGADPESITHQPRTGMFTCESPFGQGIASLKVQLGKTDWMYVVNPKEDVPTDGLPTLGEFREVANLFIPPVRQWLTECMEITRVAFGCVLNLPTKSHESGYRTLDRLLPSVAVDPNSHDFRYRINRRKYSRAVTVDYINRLSTWSVVQLRIARISGAGVELIIPPQSFACHLELDINTPAEREDTFGSEELSTLIDELVDAASEITIAGDVP